ncbi:CDP-diacylglycerol--glycerol-3-phosphate 3-phosphatidyltransferase [Rhodocyclus tenuis]|uniref:CDP-diacylglycerol--glycerol-3-phosphate 3-phosphatidyltransferase n=1 Tax=Rhodocyclus tenuis TaxID=1066 RepID=A0A840G5J0_RHOTE|nr:CDP-diacylglycerol--glycerol-3-phosphate 3-phosphatidyltransferase [Rhodocyclus tenuis]MBB4247186.1 CDP-diacylglycerol--glycerol-3-phosphate 3-phosphatidyltransferase/cardiolipin synthase [Rhodocyclus tenuis]MBK1678891.1 CDP-diacylglycerol--glycerol-3-phosphate 3-phosphatidyltransferase [Rhodocyclus tenuis]
MPFNVPIFLTWLRILLIPAMIGVYYAPESWVPQMFGRDGLATLIFVTAAATDWLDGYLARRLDQTSAFGAFLDPVADKLMVAAALIMLVQLGRLDAVIAAIIIGREITISALREWMAQIGAHRSVAVSMIGKVKTMAQMTAIPMLLYHAPVGGVDAQENGTWLIYFAAVLTLWSMGYYMRMAWPEIVAQERLRN